MDKIPETISKTIDVLAEKFGSTGSHLYKTMVEGKYTESLLGVGLGSIMCLIGLVCAYMEYHNDSLSDLPLFGLISFPALFFGITLISSNIIGVIAPEYALLMSLIGKGN